MKKSIILKPFVIIGTQRTGSTMIEKTLNLHPDIKCGGEWSLKISPLKKVSLVKAGLSGNYRRLLEPHAGLMLEKNADAIGFRLLFSSSPKWLIHPHFNLARIWERLDGFIEYFKKNPEIKIIHVIRDDNVAWLASLFMAKSSNLFTNIKYPEDLKIKIPVLEAIKRVRTKNELKKKMRTLSLFNPYFEIKYEDFLIKREARLTELFNFLEVGIPVPIPEIPTRKQQHKSLSDVIINFKEISQMII